MPVHRRQLPLAYQCEGFVPAAGSAGDGGLCERCQRQVHDVSAMRESELRRLMAKHAGGTVCLAYRVDDRGRVRLRPEPTWGQWQPLAVGALASLLGACAGLVEEIEMMTPGGYCRDYDGEEIPCVESSESEAWGLGTMEVVPSREPDLEGCPIRPTASALEATEATEASELVPTVVTAAPGAQPTSAKYRANFTVDPEERFLRGVVMVTRDGSINREFVPTVELWKEWRERRAERKRERRAVRGRTAAR